jgi:hypothetical protein
LAGAIENLPKLHTIDLNDNQKITDEGLKALINVLDRLKLKKIYLNNTSITNDGLIALAGAALHLNNL